MLEEETALKDAFQQALARHAQGELPTGNPAAEAAADAALNDAYKQALAHDWSYGTIDAAGIRGTERKWLKYRDAFVAYGTLRYPQLSASSWKTWLAQERAAQLRALIAP